MPIAAMDETCRILGNLSDLFDLMDTAYQQTATRLGFECRGCRDNCCETEFYHHTQLEYLYLRQGLASLPARQQNRILKKAAHAMRRSEFIHGREPVQRIMCPLNSEARCLLYPFRPMICRLHGVPHQLRRPDGCLQTGPGCADFESRCTKPQSGLLDRTLYYRGLAQLERELRQHTGFNQKIKLTIAEILILNL